MCAGGGCMYQISNEKFGLFVTELRKKKNLTQKDLAEKLYVSDKTVSKWERGLSMPNVVLLIPIADQKIVTPVWVAMLILTFVYFIFCVQKSLLFDEKILEDYTYEIRI